MRNNLGATLAVLTQAILLKPDDSCRYAYRSAIYEDMGDSVNALKDFDKAIELSNNHIEAYMDKWEIAFLS